MSRFLARTSGEVRRRAPGNGDKEQVALKSQQLARCVLVAGTLVLAGVMGGAAAPADHGRKLTHDVMTEANPATPAVREIAVNGRRLRISVTIRQRQWVLAKPSGATPTVATVTIEPVGGGGLPPNIVAERLTFSRVRTPLRTERMTLTPGAEGTDLLTYRGDRSPAFLEGARLKATLRLRIDGVVRTVPVGNLRVAEPPVFVFVPGQ